MPMPHLVSLRSFHKQQNKLNTEVCEAGQLRQTPEQSVELVDLRGGRWK